MWVPRTACTTLRVPSTLTAQHAVLVGLGAVDVGVGGGVQDHVRLEGAHGRAHGIRVADVQRGLARQEDLALEPALEGGGELPAGAGDEPAEHQRSFTSQSYGISGVSCGSSSWSGAS